MASVALIGPDGAGKTTMTRMLSESGLLRFKYMYMGIDIAASNVALPTSRLAEKLKARLVRRRRSALASGLAGGRKPGRWRLAWTIARLANRMADEWYRQSVSWWYQSRGFTVLYDRHFVLDFAIELAGDAAEPFDRRLHRWCLTHLYPGPDLVIFLDAPGELLFSRKGESTVEELERRRQAFLQAGRRLPAFVRVDATRPVLEVYSEVAGHVIGLSGRARRPSTMGEVAR
jgi:thymidylate kinase